MTSRFLTNDELETLFNKNILPNDIQPGYVVGVSEACILSLLIEKNKIENVDEKSLKAKYHNVLTESENGRIWIIELNSENLSRLLLDEEFYNSYCDRKDNPYDLSKRFSLYYDSSYSYWTENVYAEAFDQ